VTPALKTYPREQKRAEEEGKSRKKRRHLDCTNEASGGIKDTDEASANFGISLLIDFSFRFWNMAQISKSVSPPE
jgi:hypothetical protein